MRRLFEKNIHIVERVSGYSKKPPFEFIAECYLHMIEGMPLDKHVMKLYRQLGGAAI